MSYDNNNIFAKIIRGEISCDKVFENEHVIAFDDLHPKAKIHILVLPKGSYTDMDDFTNRGSTEEITALFKALGEIARDKGIAEDGYRMVANCKENGRQEVPHLHLHLLGGEKLKPKL